MAAESGYTVLPVSALKSEVRAVFDALKDGKVVYVSNRGRVVAAFRPYTFVPEGVAALQASPNLNLPFTVTARDIGRAVPSAAVADAAEGLPSIVEKDKHIYGMLTPATAPEPATIPDREALGAKAEAILDYQKNHPSASIDDIMAFADTLELPQEDDVLRRSWPLGDLGFGVALERDDAVEADITGWRDHGSTVEDIVEKVFAGLGESIAAFADGASVPVPTMSNLVVDSPRHNAALPARLSVVGGEQFQAAGEPVDARNLYVVALTTEEHPSVGVMWRLGNLARSVGHRAEAARWFRLSLAYDVLASTHRR